MVIGNRPGVPQMAGNRLAGARRKLKKLLATVGQVRVREGDSGPTASADTARVSVVVPVFNAMPELARLLTSLADQDLEPALFEVIAVDDGSTDSGRSLLDRFAEEYPNWRVIHQRNSGWPGSPRNVGIEAGTSEYIFFCDADDRLGREALRRMVDFADRHQSDVLAPRMIGVGRSVQSTLYAQTSTDARLRDMLASLSPQKLFRRELLDRHGIRFPEGKVRLEDGIMVTRCYLASRRTAVTADYDYYFLHARVGGANISFERTSPIGYTDSVAKIASLIEQGHPDTDHAKQLVLDLYRRKVLRSYAPRRFRSMSSGRRRRWVAAHADFVEAHVPAEMDARLNFPFRQRSQLVRARDVQGLLRLAGTEVALAATPLATVPELGENTLIFGLRLDRGSTYDAVRVLARSRASEAEVVAACGPGDRMFQVVLPRAELDRLGPVLIDLYARLRRDGCDSPPRRIQAPEQGLPASLSGTRLYATVHGNLSIDQRRSGR